MALLASSIESLDAFARQLYRYPPGLVRSGPLGLQMHRAQLLVERVLLDETGHGHRGRASTEVIAKDSL
jgi:hypothetical protein